MSSETPPDGEPIYTVFRVDESGDGYVATQPESGDDVDLEGRGQTRAEAIENYCAAIRPRENKANGGSDE